MPRPQPQAPRGQSAEVRFRVEITCAMADGVPLEGMTLRLTLRDASLLARDRTTRPTSGTRRASCIFLASRWRPAALQRAPSPWGRARQTPRAADHGAVRITLPNRLRRQAKRMNLRSGH
jgi:hypothetical protein